MTMELRDGSRVVIRQIETDDRAGVVKGSPLLKPESRYRRFFGPVTQLSERDLDYLTCVDHHDHEALVAVDAETGEGVGVARYVRTGPDVAEPAIVVVDDWQGRGAGSRLLAARGERAARGARRACAGGGHPALSGAGARVQRGGDSRARGARADDPEAAGPRGRADDRPARRGARGARPAAPEAVRDRDRK